MTDRAAIIETSELALYWKARALSLRIVSHENEEIAETFEECAGELTRALAAVPPAPPSSDRTEEVIALRAALRDMADAYVRKIKTNLTADEIVKEPWRCAEYIEAERLCRTPFKLLFTKEWLIEKIKNDPDLPCEAGAPAPPSIHPDWDGVAGWMMKHGYATGHGDTVEDMLDELVNQARPFLAPPSIPEREKVLREEREACARIADSHVNITGLPPNWPREYLDIANGACRATAKAISDDIHARAALGKEGKAG